ncbi:hypothetical protein M422DRAFT_24726 [Sphaerobolus stellatus SS14]|nr:hypothetical protein M422DRAFT_24726 [Sphaerobolus stellatus SS14]
MWKLSLSFLDILGLSVSVLGALPVYGSPTDSKTGRATTYSIPNTGFQKPTFQLTVLRNLTTEECTPASFGQTQQHRLLSVTGDEVIVEQRIFEDRAGPYGFIKVFGHEEEKMWDKAEELCSSALRRFGHETGLNYSDHSNQAPLQVHPGPSSGPLPSPPPLEVIPLLVTGQSGNRVDFVFFADGYTAKEKNKFLHDAASLALEMTQHQSFYTVQYMINFWAAFTPSAESGIGVGGKPKNTTFGLYRDGTELRGVFTSKPEVARRACQSLWMQCDYPILLGNDPYCGGMLNCFHISTASEANGPLVLRHEIGHSVIDVGEEYDGGYAYFGVNAARDPGESYEFPWYHWLSDPSAAPRAERAIMPFQTYPWTLLNKSESWSGKFTSAGTYSRYLVQISLNLGWEPKPGIEMDRWYYDFYREEALKGGEHELTFELGDSAEEGKAQLCSAEIIEYGDENEFNTTVGNYGAYPTFSYANTTTYRPTNEQCLMRNMTSPKFCNVCKEGLWMSIMKRVSVIDSLTVLIRDKPGKGGWPPKYLLAVWLTALPPPERDASGVDLPGASYSVHWQKDGVYLAQYANQTKIELISEPEVVGNWTVTVEFSLVEVKKDPYHLLRSSAHIEVWEADSQPIVTFV